MMKGRISVSGDTCLFSTTLERVLQDFVLGVQDAMLILATPGILEGVLE
jgi:hypothetical protein